MSASPVTVPSQKRPLEEPSSDIGHEDQHDAKRPALGTRDSVTDNEPAAATQDNDGTADIKDEAIPKAIFKTESDTNGTPHNENAPNGAAAAPPMKEEDSEPQPIQSMTSANGITSAGSPFPNQHVDESNWLHIRSIISGSEAATLIGKGGENVNLIRRMSGAKCQVSEYTRGAVERVLTVSGQPDHIAKAFGLIIRTLNQEDLEAASNEQSKTYPLRLLIPHVLTGSIIGQKGARIREIQEASGARLNVSDTTLPLSSERSLVILGVADAVHIAAYYVGTTLNEQLTERFGGPAASAYATRHGKPAGVVPGGMQVVPYNPQPAGGQWGHPDSYQRHPSAQPGRQPANAYGVPFARHGQPPHHHTQQQPGMQYGAAASPRPSYGGPAQQPSHGYAQQAQPQQHGYQGHPQQPMGGQPAALPGQPLTQQIFIPNDMVGAIIGKGGAKINEIRQLSGSVIKINEPQDNSNERLVTVTGTQECNQMALYMLYQRLGQSQPNPAR